MDTELFNYKIKEIREIIKMKRNQKDLQSLREADAIEKMVNETLYFARGTLTEFGEKEIAKKLHR